MFAMDYIRFLLFFFLKKIVFIRKLGHYLSENKGFDPLLHILWGMGAFIVDILFSSWDKFI
jgi:hypothetical protein